MTDSLILPPNSKAIFLTQGYYTIVDENDYEWLMQWKWRINRNRRNIYAIRNAKNEDKTPIKRACIAIHRQIMGYESPFQIDHINHNSLDNRRCNLRFCTSKQNWHNSRPRINKNSKYKGVTKNKNKGSENKWVANIMSANRKKYLGSYKTEEEAALAFDKEAIKIYGEFAYLNFPEALEEKHG